MNSRLIVIGSVAVGIAIGYIAGFLTYYSALSNVTAVDAAAIQDELQSLKDELEKAKVRASLLTEDNENLRSSLSEIRASSADLQMRLDSLQEVSADPDGVLARLEHAMMLLEMASEPMPYSGQELVDWRLAVVNDTAALDPKLVPVMLTLVDSWADIVQLEEAEPQETHTPEWERWNAEWQLEALIYIGAYKDAVAHITEIMIEDTNSLESLLKS